MKRLAILFFLLLLLSNPGISQVQRLVYTFHIKEDINAGTWRKVKEALKEARDLNANIILIDMNTYGGMLDMADSIRTAILQSPIPSIVFINNNAASAGALIAIACDKIYMREGASIGAASVVDQSGKVLPEKYQSYMRSLMRSTAEVKKRDPQIAEGFVDSTLYIPGIKERGKTLSLTTKEAIQLGYCDGQATSYADILNKEKITTYSLHDQKITFLDHFLDFITHPSVSGILIFLIIGGLYYELQSPGIGFPLLVTALSALLYFTPLYIKGLAENWEILLFIAGFILLFVETFLIPGFGLAGLIGVSAIICSLAFSLVYNNFLDFTLSGEKLTDAFSLVLLSIIISVFLILFFGKSILRSRAFKGFILSHEQKASSGYQASASTHHLAGKIGLTLTDLRPSGKVIIEGRKYDALSEGEFITKNTLVEVTRSEISSIFVKKQS